MYFSMLQDKMSTPSPTPRRTSSDIWYHFTKFDKKGKCHYCQQIISCPSGSSSNLKRHLKSKHPTVPLERCGSGSRSRSPSTDDSSAEIREIVSLESSSPISTSTSDEALCPGTGCRSESQSISSLSLSSGSGPGPGPGPNFSFATPSPPTAFRSQQPMSKFVNVTKPITLNRSMALDRQLLKMICKEYHPFSLLEDLEFKKFVNMLCPNYNLPSRKTLTNSLMPSLYNELFDKIKNDLAGAKAVCLTSDGWTSINNVSFYALTAHFIDDKTQLKSYLLECSQFEERHTAENISNWVKAVTTKYNIHFKITAIITDNASNMKSAAMLLNLRHIPCFAHSLNLVVQHAIQISIQKTVDEVKRAVMYFKKSPSALSKLAEMQENLKKDQLKLKQDVPTRWNSSYDMLQRFF